MHQDIILIPLRTNLTWQMKYVYHPIVNYSIVTNSIWYIIDICWKCKYLFGVHCIYHLFPSIVVHSPWASYQIRKIAGCACAGNAGNVFPCDRLQRKPLASDPGMHHGTCVTHVPWCMSGSLTRGGKTFPVIPAHAHPQFYVSGKRPMVIE